MRARFVRKGQSSLIASEICLLAVGISSDMEWWKYSWFMVSGCGS
jgi:hypothetical protein